MSDWVLDRYYASEQDIPGAAHGGHCYQPCLECDGFGSVFTLALPGMDDSYVTCGTCNGAEVVLICGWPEYHRSRGE